MFVQIIEGRTSDGAALMARGDAWDAELRPGATGFLGVTAGVTADGRAITCVRFKDEASAEANGNRPEQSAWWEETSKLYDGEATFVNSTDVEEWRNGGSNDAGFVQVMKSTGIDRAVVAQMDAAMEPLNEFRPDVIGGLRVWTGPDSCYDFAYFTSEAEAREGEKAEMPAEIAEQMEQFGDAMGETEYLDLSNPTLR